MSWLFALTHVLVAALTVYGDHDVFQIVSQRALPGGLELNASVIIDNYQSGDVFTAACTYQTTPALRNGYIDLKNAITEFTCVPVATRVSGWIDTRFSTVLTVPLDAYSTTHYPISACLDFEIHNGNAFVIIENTNDLLPVPSCANGPYLHKCTIDGYAVMTQVCIGNMADAPTTTSTSTMTTVIPSGSSTSTILPSLTSTTTNSANLSTTTPSSITSTTTANTIITSTPTLTPLTTLPYNIDCKHPIDDLERLFCDVNDGTTPLTSFNITEIVNKTMDQFKPDTLTPEELYLITGIIEKCSDSKYLTTENSIEIGGLIDKVFAGRASVFMESESAGHNVGATLYGSVESLMANSPSGASYLHGDNWGFIVHPMDCDEDADAGGMGDTGGGFQGRNIEQCDVSVAVDGKAACSRQSNHIYYSIYRTGRLFLGGTYTDTGIISGAFLLPNRADAATSDQNVRLPGGCQTGFLTTDGQVLSATAVHRAEKFGEKDTIIHTAATENTNIVTLRYKKKNIGVALHGKLKVTFWQPAIQQWSKETCEVRSDGDYYVSQCTHLTDFTLIVDGSSHDPILCDASLIAVNYVVVIGSILALVLLNTFYAMVFFADNEGPVGKRIESFVPRNGKDSFAAVYCLALMTFFLVFCIFSNETTTTGKRGCIAVAIINYWLLTFCIILSIFQSWIITKKFIWIPFLERKLIKLTRPAVVYAGSFGGATLMAIGFGFGTKGDFFYRNDRFCWIRADYIVAGVVLPSTFLVLNACLSLFTMTVFLFPKLFPKGLARGGSKNITRKEKIDFRERIAIIILTQFTIGLPWLFQYLTLFLKSASTWHYLFAIVNGAQGIVLLLAFAYRVYRDRKERNRPWRGSMNNRVLDERAAHHHAKTHKRYSHKRQSDPEIAQRRPQSPLQHAAASKQPTLEAVFEETEKTAIPAIQIEDVDTVTKTQTSQVKKLRRRSRNYSGNKHDSESGCASTDSSDTTETSDNDALGEDDIESGSGSDSMNDATRADGNVVGSDSGLDESGSDNGILVKAKELQQIPLRYLTIIRITSKSEPDYRLKRREYSREESEDVYVVSDVPPELDSEVDSDSEKSSVKSFVSDDGRDLLLDRSSVDSSMESSVESNENGILKESTDVESMDSEVFEKVGSKKSLNKAYEGQHVVPYDTPPCDESPEYETMAPEPKLPYTEMHSYDNVPFSESIVSHQYDDPPSFDPSDDTDSSVSIARQSDGSATNRPSENASPSLITSEIPSHATSDHSNSMDDEAPKLQTPPKKPPRRWDIFESGESFDALQIESPVSATIRLKFGTASIDPALLSSEDDDLFVKMFASHN